MDHGTVLQSLADQSPYHYVPSRTAAIIFLAFYGVSTLLHLGQATRYRMLWLFPTVCLCGLIEVLGWSGRLWSSFSPLLSTPFQIQITSTIIAPTPLLAVNFVVLGEIIKRLGSQYSRLSPKWYTIIFCTCDVVSLVVQGIGGGFAATAADLEGANWGADIMLGGIIFQLAVIVFYSALAVEFYFRYHSRAPIRDKNKETGVQSRGEYTRKLKLMTYTMAFSTVLLFIRAIYRTIELADGWNGRIIGNELYFIVLDGAMVTIAMCTINIGHPGFLLGSFRNEQLGPDIRA